MQIVRDELIYDIGTIKIADFGLSKTLPTRDAKHAEFDLDDKFKLTGETGSYRYMAREVFCHEAYNNKVNLFPLFPLFQSFYIRHYILPLFCTSSQTIQNKVTRR